MTGNFTNITGFESAITASNNISGGWVGIALVVTAFVTLTLGALPYGRNKAIVFGSFVTGILAAFMTIIGLVQYWIVVVMGVIFAGALFMLIQNRQTVG